MGAWKITKEPNEKKTLDLYNISKDRSQNWVVQKTKGLQNLTNYIKWNPNPYQYLQSYVCWAVAASNVATFC
jgi:hypothetical protein